MNTTVTVLPVRTASEYTQAKARLRFLMDAAEAENKSDEIAAQAQLIETYERVHFPLPTPDAIVAIEFRMEQQGWDRLDLAKVLAVERGRVSELMNGKRPFTVAMLRALHQKWKIPATALLSGTGIRRTRSHAQRAAKR